MKYSNLKKYLNENGACVFSYDEITEDGKVIATKELPFYTEILGDDNKKKVVINPEVKLVCDAYKLQSANTVAVSTPTTTQPEKKQASNQQTTTTTTTQSAEPKKTGTFAKALCVVGLIIGAYAVGACFKGCGKANEETTQDPSTSIEAEATPTPVPGIGIDEIVNTQTTVDKAKLQEIYNVVENDLRRFGIITDDMDENQLNEIRLNTVCAIIVANCDNLDKNLLSDLGLDSKTAIEIYTQAIKFRGYVYDQNNSRLEESGSLYPMYNLVAAPASKDAIMDAEGIAFHAFEGKKEAQEAVETFASYYSDLKPEGIKREYSPANEFAMAPYVEFVTKKAEMENVKKSIINDLKDKEGNKKYAFQERVLNNLECQSETVSKTIIYHNN